MSGCRAAREELDDNHTCPTAGARCRPDARNIVVARWRRFRLRLWLRDRKQFARASDCLDAVGVGEQSVMADALQTLRQDVEKEPPDELADVERHGLPAVLSFAPIVLPAEGDTTIVCRDETPVRDGDAVRVTRQVAQDLEWTGERRFAIDDPLGAMQRATSRSSDGSV